jgi:hypothetical protein
MSTPDALLFVYNANAGLAAGIMDSIHKTLSPSTYECQLCAVTYGAFSMKGEWRDWLKRQPWAAEFYHRPDFREAHPAHAALPLPAILRRDGDMVTPLIGAEEMARLESIGALIAAIETRLSAAPA